MVSNTNNTSSPEPPASSSPSPAPRSQGNKFSLTITGLALSLYRIPSSTIRELFIIASFSTTHYWRLAVIIVWACASLLWIAVRFGVIIFLHMLRISGLSTVLLLIFIVKRLVYILPLPIIELATHLIAFLGEICRGLHYYTCAIDEFLIPINTPETTNTSEGKFEK